MKNKLELTWVGKDEEIKVEPRILIEDPALSNVGGCPDAQNMLIHGDNLLALKAWQYLFIPSKETTKGNTSFSVLAERFREN